jgi:hypothetical protein
MRRGSWWVNRSGREVRRRERKRGRGWNRRHLTFLALCFMLGFIDDEQIRTLNVDMGS